MNDADRNRFEMLRGDGGASAEYLRDFYGLDWPWGGELREDFDVWLKQSPRRVPWDETRPSRFLIEKFFYEKRLESTKWAAARLGMDEPSLLAVLDALPAIGLRPHRYHVYNGLISTSLAKDLDSNLPSMRFRIFGDHDAYCQFLHEDLQRKLKVPIQELWCETSSRLAETPLGYPRAYAGRFDCITLEPLSVRHQMFLDFGKALFLPPDVCSKLLYAQCRPTLEPYNAGSTEPRDILDYDEVVAHA